MQDRLAHCTFCGARFTPNQAWPRRCAACGEISYRNPLPVAVVVQPVGAGLLVIRRGIPPARDRLALPGGFIEVGETWQEAAVRELREETGVDQDAAGVRLVDALSALDGMLLVFGELPPLPSLPSFVPNDETLGLEVMTGPATLGFPLHTEVANNWFARRDRVATV
ncbi:NUDIX domain-containing protein [Actinoplanes sp. NPDC049265]|uniref:NUDIX domain-containing protein n=1 Tax=Actinoplanes sp. NPDC049265 TaxID=3363902 RepID=UPI00371412CA